MLMQRYLAFNFHSGSEIGKTTLINITFLLSFTFNYFHNQIFKCLCYESKKHS